MKRLSSTGRIVIIAILIALAAAAEVLAAPSPEILKLLSASGLKEGVNTDGTVVAVAVARGMVEDPAAASALSRRNALASEAEMRARQELLTLLMREMSGSRGERQKALGDEISKDVTSELSAKAQLIMRGCGVIDSVEELGAKGGYKVSVAVGWRLKTASCAEKAVSGALADRSGPIPVAGAAGGKVDEWRRWASGAKLDCKFGVRKFVGTDGLLRYAGLGFADIEGLPKGSAHLRAAQKLALDQARANLAITLSADTISGESVVEMLSERDGEDEASTVTSTSMSSRVDAVVSDLTTNAPEVYSTIGVDPLTGRKIYISVCGWEPWQLAKLIKRNQGPVKPYIAPVDPTSGSMKQWNPITSRFE